MNHYALLRQLHASVQPRAYLEIGTSQGASLALAACPSVAIDPRPDLSPKVDVLGNKPWLKVYRSTSDDFFASHEPASTLDGLPLDLAFIDGMHRIENVIRDVVNCERWSHPGGILAIHDVLPQAPDWASREPRPRNWTGDVWRVVPCLRRYRPDLDLTLLDAAPSGMLIVRNLDAGNRVLLDRLPEILAGYLDDPRPYQTQVEEFLAGEHPRSTESWAHAPAADSAPRD